MKRFQGMRRHDRLGTAARRPRAALYAWLGAAATALLIVQPAQAQFVWGGGFAQPEDGPPELSVRDIAQITASRGMRLLTTPFRNGNVYVADVLDRFGNQDRLIISGDGAIIQRMLVRRGSVARSQALNVVPAPAPEPSRSRGFFGFLQGDKPPVPSEDVPASRQPPAFASASPQDGLTTDVAPLPQTERPKPKRKLPHAKRPEAASLAAPTDATNQNATAQPADVPKLDTQKTDTPRPAESPVKANAAVDLPTKSIAVSQTPARPRIITARPAAAPKPAVNKPLNDVPPAPLD